MRIFQATYLALAFFILVLVGCGSGSSSEEPTSDNSSLQADPESPAEPEPVDSSTPSDNGIECQRATSESSLDLNPVYAFEGLWSNWLNGEDLAGFTDTNMYLDTFSNLTAVSIEDNDEQLKSKLVDSLHRWASQDAFVGTKLCYRPGGDCTGWQDPAGYDVSDGQSYNFVLLNVEQLRMIYSYLAEWATENEPDKHDRISQWFQYWEETMPQPDGVYFGLGTGFYQWKIQQLMDKGNLESAREFATTLINGIESHINEDGSIVDRTTRGDRALWYHHSALNEIMGSIWTSRQLRLETISFDSKIHSAVDIFIKTIEDPSYIFPWASVSLNNGGTGEVQIFNGATPNDFTNWYHGSSGGTWFYLYMSEYPDHPNAQELRRLIPSNAGSASQDNLFFPLGCMLF